METFAWKHNSSRGNTAQAFAESDVVLERTYRTGAINHAPIEPHACVAGFDHRGRLTVWTATQQLSVCHAELATALDLSMAEVKVNPRMRRWFRGQTQDQSRARGGAFAQKTGQSVRLAMRRDEEFIAANGRAPFKIKIKLGRPGMER